jgi:hypothetical protein
MWVVLYDDGTSLTTVSEPIARTLAEAERQRGRQVTVRRVDDDVDSAPTPEPIRPADEMARPEPASEPEPTSEPGPTLEPEPTIPAVEPTAAVEPARAAEPIQVSGPAREAGPARAARPARRRRLVPYALAAVSIVAAAALADHWNVLPAVGATTSSSSAQVSGPPHHAQLLPPLDQPPVTHFSNTARGG